MLMGERKNVLRFNNYCWVIFLKNATVGFKMACKNADGLHEPVDLTLR